MDNELEMGLTLAPRQMQEKLVGFFSKDGIFAYGIQEDDHTKMSAEFEKVTEDHFDCNRNQVLAAVNHLDILRNQEILKLKMISKKQLRSITRHSSSQEEQQIHGVHILERELSQSCYVNTRYLWS